MEKYPMISKLMATLTIYMKYAKLQHEIVEDKMLNERAKVERLKTLTANFKKALMEQENLFLKQYQFNPQDLNDCTIKEQHKAVGLEFDFYKN